MIRTTRIVTRSAATIAVAGAALTFLAPAALAQQDKARVALVEINTVTEVPGPLDWLFPSDEHATLRTVVDTLQDAAERDDLDAVVIRLKDAQLNLSQVHEIGAAMKQLSAAGKRVVLFSDAYGTSEIVLGSFANETVAQSGSGVSFPGIYMEEMFLADTLAWAGLQAQLVQVGAYKGANEQMTRSQPSPEWDENITQLLDGLYGSVRQPVLAGRKMSESQLDDAMRKTWMADAEDAQKAGLIDTVIDLPDLEKHLQESMGKPIAWTKNLLAAEAADFDMAGNPFAMLQMLSREPDTDADGPTIAILHVGGTIVDGESSEGGMFGGSSNVGSRTIRRTIEDLAKDDDIKGVIVRIDSPGGSATASEVMWQGLHRLAEKKPVWTSVGSMAASGGYYLAVAGDKIYVSPSSIVGSIGVVGGKFTMSGLYDHLKVNVVGRGRGPMADLFASDQAWNADQEAMVRTKMTETFDKFKSRVAQGRKGIDLSKTAGGWLFTGEKAIKMKMADKIGGLDVAIDDMAKQLSLDEFEVMDYPGARSLEEVIGDAMKGFASAPNVGALAGQGAALAPVAAMGREVFGPAAWPAIEQAMNGMAELRKEPVIMMSPKVIYFK